MTSHAVAAGIFVIVVIETVAPVGRSVASEQGDDAFALHIGGRLDAGEVEEGLGKVDILNQVGVDGSRLNDARPFGQ